MMKDLRHKFFKLKYFVVFICIALVFAVIFNAVEPKSIPNRNGGLPRKQAKITNSSGKTINLTIEVASSSQELALGLSNRSMLEPGFGMYFELPARNYYSFWMKDMRFPIDIIWIDQGKIVGIEKNAQVPKDQNNISTFKSPSQVTNVLEVNAGFSEQNFIDTGDKVALIS